MAQTVLREELFIREGEFGLIDLFAARQEAVLIKYQICSLNQSNPLTLKLLTYVV